MSNKEKRRLKRTVYQEPVLAVVHAATSEDSVAGGEFPLFVGVQDFSDGGFMIVSPRRLSKGAVLYFSLYDFSGQRWHEAMHRVAWACRKEDREEFSLGLEKVVTSASHAATPPVFPKERQQLLADIIFLLKTNFLRSISRHAIWSLLNCLRRQGARSGDFLIKQGDAGDRLFIIQEGRCLVLVDKEEKRHQVAQLGAGDVVGEMAVLTGEPRYASVIADTDMKLWELGKEDFTLVSRRYPDLLMFLTELVSKRLESSSHTANRTVGKYMINLKLGHGAWGIIYQGVHIGLNMPVAVKMLKHQWSMDEDFREKFLKEAKVIAVLNHKNIVQVFDIEESYKTLFIIMEYLEGNSLEDLLKQRGTLPWPQAAAFLMQICSGLEYGHRKGIVHQDIKPANIQILANDQIKILDFGLACPVGSENFEMEGTVQYMSPEQINRDPVDAKTDIYNLGITAYEMVTGQRPYPEDDLAALMDLHVNEDIPDPALLVPDLPRELQRFIVKSCARDPGQRYQNMTEAMAEIEPYFHAISAKKKVIMSVKQHMTSVFFMYNDEQVKTLNLLLEEINGKAAELGVSMRVAEFKDIR